MGRSIKSTVVNVHIPKEIHRDFKAIAAKNGMTLKGLFIKTIKEKIENESKE